MLAGTPQDLVEQESSDILQDLVEAQAPKATAAVTRSRFFSAFMIF
jgi:hypothetical protein